MGFSGPAEDLLPVSEVKAGVSSRPAGQARRQVCCALSERRPGPFSRWSRRGAVTPSIHPEVPDSQYVSPGRGVSGSRWAGRRCAVPRTRGSGCQRVTPEVMCYPPILTTTVCSGGSGDHTILPGSRQGTTVCVHTRVEQHSDHKQTTPTGME